MKSISAAQARSGFHRLLREVATSHEPVAIRGRRGSAVLVAGDDWRAINETLFLLSVPGMRGSVRQGLDTLLEECSAGSPW